MDTAKFDEPTPRYLPRGLDRLLDEIREKFNNASDEARTKICVTLGFEVTSGKIDEAGLREWLNR